jgi:hypothetical protein
MIGVRHAAPVNTEKDGPDATKDRGQGWHVR